MKPATTPERLVLKACQQWLALHRVLHWRQNSGGVIGQHNGKSRFVRFNSAKGMSDLCAVLPGGRFAAIEVKRPGKHATAEQSAFLASVVAAGGVAVVVHSVDELSAAIKPLLDERRTA